MFDFLRPTQFRMGVNVPAGTETTTSQAGVTTSRPTYRYVGTSIDCAALSLDDGRFRVSISIDDSSIFTPDSSSPIVRPGDSSVAFRSLTTSNRITIRDGQTVLFATAADRLTGDVVKVDVTVAVIK